MPSFTFDKLVDAVTSQFDCTQARAVDAVNDAAARMSADARWRMAKKALGTTVSGQSNYALPAETVDLASVRVDYANGVVIYDPVSIEELWSIDAQPGARLIGPGGVFAADFDASGAAQIRLYPAPDTSGLDITALEAVSSTDSSYGASDNISIPQDLRMYLKDGAYAQLYAETDEDQAKADYHEQRFQQGTELLRRRKNSRMDGSPQYLRVSRRPFGWR